MPLSSRHLIRQQIRQRRQHLTAGHQHQASLALLQQAQQCEKIEQAQHIALYLSNDGEISTRPLINWLWQTNRQVYLPVLHPFSNGHLLFLHYSPDTHMTTNRYGIQEPKLDIRLVQPLNNIDVICTPLVAFDQSGQRLGMGGGYYDRTLHQWHQYQCGPYPLGLAHDCQYVEHLPSEAWDVPLPKILTPSTLYQWP